MTQRFVTLLVLVCFVLFESGCYTLKSYKPQEVKPGWEIAYVVKTNTDTVRFDDEDQGTVQGKWVIGSQRNSFAELRPRRVLLDSVDYMCVHRPDWSTKGLIIAGVGVGIAAFVIVEMFNQHRTKTTDHGMDNSGGGTP